MEIELGRGGGSLAYKIFVNVSFSRVWTDSMAVGWTAFHGSVFVI